MVMVTSNGKAKGKPTVRPKVNFTAGRIAAFACPQSKPQDFLWCTEPQGLGIRTTPGSTRKSYIFQAKVNRQTMRLTIGDVATWSIEKAKAEARRLKVLIDQGNDPRQVRAEKADADVAKKLAKEAAAAAIVAQQSRESVTVAEAWEAYVAERSASIKDGKPEWGEIHTAHHASFVHAGGVRRKRGRRTGESAKTRPGILVPLMRLKLIQLDGKMIAAWVNKAKARAPTTTAQAYRALSAFQTWCGKHDEYKGAAHPDACQAEAVKKAVPTPKPKSNDSLRKAQLMPWFESVQKIGNPIIAAYLQSLLLTGARRNELAALRWEGVDFQWKTLTIRDKVEGVRTIPLTPYVEHLISVLPHRNEFVFSSPAAESGRLEEPRIAHSKALAAAGLPGVSLHGLRRSFATLSEWVEVPVGIVAQIMGHKPSAIAEKHYIERELDLLHKWHVKIESWILEQAEISFVPTGARLRAVGKKVTHA